MKTATRSPVRAALDRCWEAQAAYISSGSSDFAPMAAALHPEIVLLQANSLPYGGQWRGHRGLEAWLAAMERAWESVEVRDPEIVEQGDTVVVSATFTARARTSGTAVRMPICEVIRFADSLPIKWQVFYLDTAEINRALG